VHIDESSVFKTGNDVVVIHTTAENASTPPVQGMTETNFAIKLPLDRRRLVTG
jgi:plastocyanin domain-containing protein